MLVRYRGDRTVFLVIVLCGGDFVFAQGLSTLVIPPTAEFHGAGAGTWRRWRPRSRPE